MSREKSLAHFETVEPQAKGPHVRAAGALVRDERSVGFNSDHAISRGKYRPGHARAQLEIAGWLRSGKHLRPGAKDHSRRRIEVPQRRFAGDRDGDITPA